MATHLLPGGDESLLANFRTNPFAVVEIGTRGFVRLRGKYCEGKSYRRCVWDAIASRVPSTVRAFSPGDYGSAAYIAAMEAAGKGEA